MKKFSLLIAHYNNYDYFKDCYQSILNQTYQDFEVIIVDDCSTDGSFEKLQNLIQEDARFKLYRNTSNKGVGFTKKRCADLATGDICGFLDPDDALKPNAIEKSVKVYSSPDIVATYSKIILCDEKLKCQSIFSKTSRVQNNDQFFFNINNEISHFFSFRKDAYYKTSGINSELKSAVDFDLYLKLYEIGNFVFVNTPLYYYRQHQAGVSQDKMIKKSVHKNWNKVLYDTCLRRNIQKIGDVKVQENANLAKAIFEQENTFFKRLSRYIRKRI